jgi:hypothetical protein
MAKSNGALKRGKAVERFADRGQLLAAVRAWCAEELRRRGAHEAAAGQLAEQVEGLRAIAEDATTREVCNEVRAALHRARNFLRQDQERRMRASINGTTARRETFYLAELRRVVDAITSGGAWPPDGPDSEMSARRLLLHEFDRERRVGRREPLNDVLRKVAELANTAALARDVPMPVPNVESAWNEFLGRCAGKWVDLGKAWRAWCASGGEEFKPERFGHTNREVALLSLLGGMGLDWATKACRRAKDSRGPTVMDLVRAEEKAIGLARDRLAAEQVKRRAAALAFIEGAKGKRTVA